MGQTSSFPRPEVDTYNVCAEISDPNGSLLTQQVGRSLQWFTFVLSWLQLAFYGYQSFRATMGWEETYVCIIEAIKITLDIFYMYASPATIYQTNGNTVNWLTYSEWLLTCPVILVQLCNITGLESDFNDRTMQVLISDVGAIVFGVSSAFSEGPLKMFFFLCGCCYGIFTFYHAAKIYYESYHMVPDGLCRNLVRYMAWCFYISWVGFPIIFLTGADGYGPLTIWAEVALQQIVEVLAKNVWGMLGHILRLKIHEHIIMYGDVRKPNKIKFGGKEVRILSWTDKEDENTIRKSAKHLVGRRSSFLRMRDQMKRRGIPTRGSRGTQGASRPAVPSTTSSMTAEPSTRTRRRVPQRGRKGRPGSAPSPRRGAAAAPPKWRRLRLGSRTSRQPARGPRHRPRSSSSSSR
uniref:O protein n=1 Tax=Tetraselmis sp. GSL018 TaxID=582737 RepID=A0A061QPX0_9CHLO